MSLLPWLFVGAAGLVVLLVLHRLKRRTDIKEPPVVKAGLPAVGPLVAFSAAPFQFLRSVEKQYGQAFTLDLLFDKMTFILGREGNKVFYDAADQVLDFNSAVQVVSENVLGSGVFTMDLVWNTKSNPYITKGFMRLERLALYGSIINDEVVKHVNKWMQMDKVDLFKSVSSLITSINIRCVIGDDAYEKHADEIASLYYQLELSAVDTIALLFPKLPTPTKYRNAKARGRLIEIISDVLHSRANGEDTLDYIGMVWKEEKQNHKIDILAVHALGILFAAHTNTAGTTAWTLAQFAKDKTLRENALREQTELMTDIPEDAERLSPNFISKLEYLDCCMKETVRRYGIMMLVRKAMVDCPFKAASGEEFVIPKGRMVVSSPMLTHFNEEVYPNPLQYNPDRWVDPERKISVINNRNYVQFGYGRHRCLGERFANLVIKTTLSRILRMCVPELLEPLPDPDYRKATGTPGPERTIFVRFHPKSD